MKYLKIAIKGNFRRLYGKNRNWGGGLRMAFWRTYRELRNAKSYFKRIEDYNKYVQYRENLETHCKYFCPRGRSDWDVNKLKNKCQ